MALASGTSFSLRAAAYNTRPDQEQTNHHRSSTTTTPPSPLVQSGSGLANPIHQPWPPAAGSCCAPPCSRSPCFSPACISHSQPSSSPPTTSRPLPRPAATTPTPTTTTTTTTTTAPLEQGSGGDVPGAGDVVGGVVGRACTYTVEIKTSCSSPRSSTDAVSLAFGDAYRNEAYAARVTPARGFERCARDTFRVSGPCGYGVCYLYLRRTGGVGWTPEWVRVYEPTSSTPSTFYFGDPLANGVWYGTDRCLRRAGAAAVGASSEPVAAAQAL